MKEELYLWIRNLAVFYIFFTAVLNLIPDRQYEKYVRFYGTAADFYDEYPNVFHSWKRSGTDREFFK